MTGVLIILKRDADVNVSVVAQNFVMVKMAGRSFGREKNYGLTVTVQIMQIYTRIGTCKIDFHSILPGNPEESPFKILKNTVLLVVAYCRNSTKGEI